MHRDITASPEYRQALQLYQQGRLAEAFRVCVRLDKAAPRQPAVLELVAVVALGLGKVELACTKLQEQVRLQKRNASAHSNLSMALYAAGMVAEAVRQAQKAIKLEPGLAQAHNNLGNAYKKLGDLDRAAVAYRRALALGVNDPRVTMNLSETCYQLGRLEEAAKLAEEAVSRAQGFPPAYKNLGAIYMQQGRLEEARQHLEKALSLDPSDHDARVNMAMLKLSLFEPKEAQRHLEEVLAINPRHTGALVNLGVIREDQGRCIEAKELYRLAIESDPGMSPAYANFARLLFEEGREREARDLLTRALNQSVDKDLIYLDWASYEELANNPKRARELLNRVTDRKTLKSDKDWARARLQMRNKDFESALETLRAIDRNKLVRTDSDFGMLFDLGRVYDELGRYSQAYSTYEQANAIKNRRKGRFYDQDADTKNNRAIQDAFSRDNWAGLRPHRLSSGIPGPQPIFIVGFPRSGTSLLEQILGMHPEVTPLGELDGLLAIVTNSYKQQVRREDRYPRGLVDALPETGRLDGLLREYRDFYLETARRASGYQEGTPWFTDKLPHNAAHIGLINLLFPDSPIIRISRHPLDSCLSAYFSNFTAGHSYTATLESTARHYRHVMSSYSRVKAATGIETLEMKYEDLVRQQEDEVKRLLEFLDLRWEPACLQHERSSRKVRTGSQDQVTEKIYTSSVYRHLNYMEQMGPAIQVLKETIEAAGYPVPDRIGPTPFGIHERPGAA